MARDAVAIVTGAARSIALAAANRLACRGLRVAAIDIDGDALDATDLPGATLRLAHDIADPADQLVAEITDALGTPTVLVNNAAYMDGRSLLELPS